MFWPFTLWINCSSDLKHLANSWPSALNFKSFSRSLQQFFLTVGQNNFSNKIPDLFLLLIHNNYQSYGFLWIAKTCYCNKLEIVLYKWLIFTIWGFFWQYIRRVLIWITFWNNANVLYMMLIIFVDIIIYYIGNSFLWKFL